MNRRVQLVYRTLIIIQSWTILKFVMRDFFLNMKTVDNILYLLMLLLIRSICALLVF